MATDNRVARMYAEDDLFSCKSFDHLEFTVCDALTCMRYLKFGFGMELVALTTREYQNYAYSSYVLKAGNVKFVITAPYVAEIFGEDVPKHSQPNPKFDAAAEAHFFSTHGNGVSRIGIKVTDVNGAYKTAVGKGAKGIVEPTVIEDGNGGSVTFAEIRMYDDDDTEGILQHMPDVYEGVKPFTSNTNVRFIQYDNFDGPFLPGYKNHKEAKPLNYGLQRIDHVVGNVYRMEKVVNDVKNWTGFHTFAFFLPEDIRTKWSSLNSEVLASNNADILLPINEAAPGKKESQILKYLRAYQGPGVQHVAIKTKDIFNTLEQITSSPAGVEFLYTPDEYYKRPEINERLDKLVAENPTTFPSKEKLLEQMMKYRVLLDQDENGTLLQIFTKPLFDRPTLFIEIIQRVCIKQQEIPGCGRFGRGNFKALFETLEAYFEGKDN